MAKIAEFIFDQASDSDLIDSGGSSDNSGTLHGDTSIDGNGSATFDGDGDYAIIDPDPVFALTEGTIAIEFTQASQATGNNCWGSPDNCAMVLFSTDCTNFGTDPGHLTIYVDKSGNLTVRHQTEDTEYQYTGGPVVVGEPVQMSYSFGPEGSILTINGQVVVTDSTAHTMAGGTNPIAIGGSLAQCREGEANNVNAFFDGEIDRVSIYNTQEDFNTVIPCFLAGTLILTPDGEVAVQDLKPGDMVITRDSGPQPIRWITTSNVTALSLEYKPKLRPIRIPASVLGGDNDLLVSRQHCVLMQMNGQEVLVRAAHLAKHAVAVCEPAASSATYVHLLLAEHHIVYANGAPAETLLVGGQGARALRQQPNTKSLQGMRPARRVLDGCDVRRLLKKGQLCRATVHLPYVNGQQAVGPSDLGQTIIN